VKLSNELNHFISVSTHWCMRGFVYRSVETMNFFFFRYATCLVLQEIVLIIIATVLACYGIFCTSSPRISVFLCMSNFWVDIIASEMFIPRPVDYMYIFKTFVTIVRNLQCGSCKNH
jgi:hypothetical protein